MNQTVQEEITRNERKNDWLRTAAAITPLRKTDPTAYVAAIRALRAEGATFELIAKGPGRTPSAIHYTVNTAKGAYKRS